MRKKFAVILCIMGSLLLLVSCGGQTSDSSPNESGGDSTVTCLHTYDNACDKDCNVCGEERTPAEHHYDEVCDESCNVCGDTRVAEAHTYDNACDAVCNVCDAERIVSGHVYDNEYDAKCNVCGDERKVPEDPVNGGNWTGEAPLK